MLIKVITYKEIYEYRTDNQSQTSTKSEILFQKNISSRDLYEITLPTSTTK